MIYFNVPCITGKEEAYIKEALENEEISGDGVFTKKCHAWLENTFKVKKALLTTSGTHALDMTALLLDIEPGDEVIMPSYTFSSTANAFVLRGAKIAFVDIRPDTMNIDENLIEAAINKKTKAICVMHYAGVACEMKKILEIAARYGLPVVEDAAQGVMAKYNDQYLGSIGDLGCYSFHETKNYTCGEGGALLINNSRYQERSEIIREKGTDRSKFYRGQVDKYGWVDLGSSFLPSDINAAFLYAQLEQAEKINKTRLQLWQRYYDALTELQKAGCLELPVIPKECTHNAHMFYIKLKDLEERTRLIAHLKDREIMAVFHYLPLHSAVAGKKYGYMAGNDKWTTRESERLLRLPLWYKLTPAQVDKVTDAIKKFFK
jgi:dTDP-4-amino-4,6-dideoxygalactose transaminase